MIKDFLSIADLTTDEIQDIFTLSTELKRKQKSGESHRHLENKTMAMIFQKPSARTRVSFEVGMFQLGGQALYLNPNDIQIGKRESFADVARTLSRYVDLIMARLFGHELIEELAENSGVPVINGLTDLLHPCQVMADQFSIFEKKAQSRELRVAYIGDGNNMANSWINMASRIGMQLNLAVPEGYEPDDEILSEARREAVSEIKIFIDPLEAAEEADVIYTDVWASMGQEEETETRKVAFQGFQVNETMLARAKADCLVMHCLPAHRGDEITDEVIDGPNSIVFDQAENRLHVQKAIMVKLMQ